MRRLLSRNQHPHEVARQAARLAAEYAIDPEFRTAALAAVTPHLARNASRAVDGREWPAALYAFARTIAHVREPAIIGEILLHPRRVIEWRAGDCDDVSMCVAAIAAHVGLPSAILSIWTGPESAHQVAVVGPRWYGAAAPSIVIDPEQPKPVDLASSLYRFGRLFPVVLRPSVASRRLAQT